MPLVDESGRLEGMGTVVNRRPLHDASQPRLGFRLADRDGIKPRLTDALPPGYAPPARDPWQRVPTMAEAEQMALELWHETGDRRAIEIHRAIARLLRGQQAASGPASCQGCGQPVERSSVHGKQPSWCSDACRKRAERQRAKDRQAELAAVGS